MPPESSTPASSGKSMKMYYIIGAGAVILIVLWLLMRGAGGAPGVSQNVDGSQTYTDAQGNTATVGGTSMPDNWPSDAPANYAGAAIQYSGNSNPQTGKAGAAVVYSASATAQSVVDYYKAQLSAKGWVVAGTANMGGATVLSATKDDRTFGVYIVDSGEGKVAVTAGIEL